MTIARRGDGCFTVRAVRLSNLLFDFGHELGEALVGFC